MTEKEIQNLIKLTAEETVKQINQVATIEPEQRDYFKETEQLLYNYKTLSEHVEDVAGYFQMLNKRSGGSVVRYTKNKPQTNESEVLRSRYLSYERSREQVKQLEKAFAGVKEWKEYRVLELRYFERDEKGEVYSYEQIADILSQEGIEISEKTIRRWKNNIIKDISIRLFGLDAI